MSISEKRRRAVVVETLEEEVFPVRPQVEEQPKVVKKWKPGELHNSLSHKLSKSNIVSEPRQQLVNKDEVKLPTFFQGNQVNLDSLNDDELLDIKGAFTRFFKGASQIQSISMPVPVFLTTLVLLTAISFFAGRFSTPPKEKAVASDATIIAPVDKTNQRVQGTPDEIISQIRQEFANAIAASKNEQQTEAERELVSRTILGVLDKLGSAIQAYPDVASLYFERAQVEKMVMQSAPTLKPQAEGDYKKAIELSPLSSAYYIGFADYYDVLGQSTLAIENYEKAIQLDPKNIDALYPLAKMYSSAGRKNEAIVLYQKLSGMLSPNSPQYTQVQQELLALQPEPTPQVESSNDSSPSAEPTP